MKKFLLTAFLIMCFFYLVFGGSFTEINSSSLTGVSYSSIVLGDIDNDGDLDLILSGTPGSGGISKIYQNNGTGSFTEINPGSLTGVYYSSNALGDIDNDGDLDLILTGYTDPDSVSKIYQNNGAGSFTEINPGSLTGVFNSSIALGDLDNDGDLDLILSGIISSEIISKIYQNDGVGSFTEINPGSLTGLVGSSIALGDIDNDGDLDLILTGYDFTFFISKIYKNDGTGNFTEINSGTLTGIYYSSVAFGDLDTDGDLDLILTGNTGAGFISKIYQNNGTGLFTEINSGCLTEVWYSSIALGDIDTDGDLDLILTGQTGTGGISTIYQNNGTGSFTEINSGSLTGVCTSSISLGDIDNDGDLDLILTGFIGPDSVSKIYQNNELIKNNVPSIPENLSTMDNSGFWRLSWSASNDDHTNSNLIRYKIAISTGSDSEFNYISEVMDLPRGQANIGNLYSSGKTIFQTKIPTTEKIFWKVKAIDTSFKTSDWSQICSSHYSISGQITDYSPSPISDVTVSLVGSDTGTIQTSATGYFIFPDLQVGGIYTIFPSKSNYSFNPLSKTFSGLDSDQIQNFMGISENNKIYGYVRDSEGNPINNVKLKVSGRLSATTISNKDGYFEFSGLESRGDYTIKAIKPGYEFEPENIKVFNLTSDQKIKITGKLITLENLYSYPNPYKAGDSETRGITFANLTEDTTIQLYNISGDLVFEVKTSEQSYTWDLINNSGDSISSGTYFFLITNNKDQNKTGKIVVIK
ncbi:MAG: FG-GAP-like repeat-containing protein [bacterium]|nr:FG-GAP-like repeat-containing protein [bacterium]